MRHDKNLSRRPLFIGLLEKLFGPFHYVTEGLTTRWAGVGVDVHAVFNTGELAGENVRAETFEFTKAAFA